MSLCNVIVYGALKCLQQTCSSLRVVGMPAYLAGQVSEVNLIAINISCFQLMKVFVRVADIAETN